MAYTIISQNNTTTTLQDENGNIIYVPGRVTLATSTDYTITEVNNNTATLTDGSGNVIRDVPCVVVLAGNGGGGGGSDPHNLGFYADLTALQTAHPTGSDGDFAILGSTDTVWVWDSGTSAWKDTDTKGQVTSVNGQTGAVTVDTLPSQTGNAGKFLTTDGTDASWSDKPLVNTSESVSNSFTTQGATQISQQGDSTAVGVGANANNTGIPVGGHNTAFGAKATANSAHCSAFGSGAKAIKMMSNAFGKWAQANGNGALALGCNAIVNANNAIQLNASLTNQTNSDANTVKIANANGNYEMMSADGTIPTARLTKVNTTITLAAADWSSNTQTVNVTGMTADGVVMVSPDPTNQSAYTSAGVLCTAQAAGTLTFTCDTVPAGDLSVNVVML